MSYSLNIQTAEHTLFATLVGAVSKAEYLEARSQVMQKAKEVQADRILFDLREAQLLTTTIGVFSVAATTASVVPSGAKYAVIVSTRTIDPSDVKFGENVATNRGACLKTFEDEHSARNRLGIPPGACAQ